MHPESVAVREPYPHVRGPVICVWPSGMQSPTNPMKVNPGSAVGCSSTGTPSGCFAEQTEPFVPHRMSMPSSVPPAGTGEIVSVCVGATVVPSVIAASKLAPHVRAAFMIMRPPGAQSPV